MGLMWLESVNISSLDLLKVLDILFNFFAIIPVDSVVLFHVGRIHAVEFERWQLLLLCAADGLLQHTDRTTAVMSSLCQSWFPLMAEYLLAGEFYSLIPVTPDYVTSFAFISRKNPVILNLGSNNVANVWSGTLLRPVSLVPENRWCHSLCITCYFWFSALNDIFGGEGGLFLVRKHAFRKSNRTSWRLMTTQLAFDGLQCIHLIVSISILDTAAVSVVASCSSFISITVQGCTINTLLITKSKNLLHSWSCFSFCCPVQL